MPLPPVIDQLRAVKSALQYSYGDAERDPILTQWLADLISLQGIDDLRNIASEKRRFTFDFERIETVPGKWKCTGGPEGTEQCEPLRRFVKVPVPFEFEIFYNRLTFADLPEVNTGHAKSVNYVGEQRQRVFAAAVHPKPAWGFYGLSDDPLRAKRTHFEIYVNFLGENIPYFIFYPIVKQSGGIVRQFLNDLAPFAPVISLGLNFFAPGFGAAIGQAVLGASAAAAYPLLASAIGNAAIGSVLSGGNVKAAVASALAGVAGSAAGGSIASALDSQLTGQVAAAATSAAILGQDPREAAKWALLQSGAQSLKKG